MIKGSRIKIYRTSFCISLFLFVISFTCAQDTLLYSSTPGLFKVRYIQNAGERDKNSNEIIETIAEDAIKPPTKTQITLDFQFQIKTVEKIPVVLSLFVSIRNPFLKGDVYFRKFGIRDVLLPDRIDLDMRVWKKTDPTSVMESKVSHLLWTGSDSPVFIGEIHGFGKNWDTLEVKNLFFYHDEEALSLFKEKVHLINDYFASSFVADSLLLMADAMDLRNTGQDPLNFIRLREINKMVDLFNRKKFLEKLDLIDHDPAGLNAKMIRLFKFSKSADMTFRENLRKNEIINQDFSIDSMVNYFLSGILRYIRWSLIMTTYNGRIYQEYLDDYFVKPAFGSDDPELQRELLVKLFPGSDPDSLFKSLSETLKKAYERQAEWLMQQDQFTEAVKILENESQFCQVNPYLAGEMTDRKLQARAVRGIYLSYLAVAEMCTENGKYNMAQDYLAKAQGYRHDDPDSGNSDSLFNKVFHKIFNTWIAGCDSLAAHGEFEKAVNCYHQIETRLDTSFHAGHEEIAIRINLAKKSLMHDSLGRIVYRNDMINLLTTGESKIWTGRYNAAGIFADSVEQQFRVKGFAYDSLVVKAIREYRKKIKSHRCWDSNESFEILILRAQNEIEKKHFTEAGVLLDSALSVAASAPLCNINIAQVMDTLKKYSVASQYQQNIIDIRKNIGVNKYDEVLEKHSLNEGLYHKNDLIRFGLELFPLYGIIVSKGDPLFMGHAIVFYFNRDSLAEAFRYVKLLRSQGYPRRNAKDLLEILGKKMGAEDFRKYPEGNPDSLVEGYIGDNGWFRNFKTSYLNEWSKRKEIKRLQQR